ncbi:MAG: hypothetical protein OXI05_01980 [Bacteroidota bacterium]|nr:hypothetical protein [Bacteroidota bacterium]MDE2644593.1 hypothetical protein [Bacteroidota bacterium]
MKGIKLPVFAVILLCSVVHFGCDSGSELFLENEEKGEMEYEYVEVDLALMAELDQMTDTDAIKGEPQIEFFDDREPIKRFWSYEDYYTSVDLISEKSRLTGDPILIHQSLRQYLEYKHVIPIEELALVNYEGRLIIGDTLYTLAGTSYTKQHVDDSDAEVVDLSVFDPSEEIRDYLSKLLQDQGASRVTDVLISRKSVNSSGVQSGCGRPDDFGFAGGVHPARSVEHTDMCASDFNYSSIKANPGDDEFTSNSPGAVLMWNTSYQTWSGSGRGIANTQFFKYRDSNGGYFLDYVSSTDLPDTQTASVSVTVITSRGSKSGHGILSTWATKRRTRGRSTRSTHSASLGGVSGLPAYYRIDY